MSLQCGMVETRPCVRLKYIQDGACLLVLAVLFPYNTTHCWIMTAYILCVRPNTVQSMSCIYFH